MDVPICIGVTLALGMSVVETVSHAEHAYFDAAIMLLTFLRTLSRPEHAAANAGGGGGSRGAEGRNRGKIRQCR
jgi:cation transport ATPase